MAATTSPSVINAAVKSAAAEIALLGDNDRKFLSRCYNGGDLDKYRARVNAIGFCGHGRILDAGCGFGQWSLVLSESNERVVATDIDQTRIDIARKISSHLGIRKVGYQTAAMDNMPLRSNEIDAIFSYNALALSPFRQTLREFARLLKPGGLLYFNGYDLGWMIYNIIDSHNPAADYDPRQWAIEAIQNTLRYLSGGSFTQRTSRDSLLMPEDIVRRDLQQHGFDILSQCGDGQTSLFKGCNQEPFFPSEKYGLPAVYEMLCKKR